RGGKEPPGGGRGDALRNQRFPGRGRPRSPRPVGRRRGGDDRRAGPGALGAVGRVAHRAGAPRGRRDRREADLRRRRPRGRLRRGPEPLAGGAGSAGQATRRYMVCVLLPDTDRGHAQGDAGQGAAQVTFGAPAWLWLVLLPPLVVLLHL